MIKIISPNQYKTIPWKNGRGETTELAISPNGTLDDFDWRLSIASVVENGVFSDFSGYDRQLILLDGNGIKLTHNHTQIDDLVTPLSKASFAGSCHTMGELYDGPIHDFNVMTKQQKYRADVNTYIDSQTIRLSAAFMRFIYATNQSVLIQSERKRLELPANHLLQINSKPTERFQVMGADFVVISLFPRGGQTQQAR